MGNRLHGVKTYQGDGPTDGANTLNIGVVIDRVGHPQYLGRQFRIAQNNFSQFLQPNWSGSG